MIINLIRFDCHMNTYSLIIFLHKTENQFQLIYVIGLINILIVLLDMNGTSKMKWKICREYCDDITLYEIIQKLNWSSDTFVQHFSSVVLL